MTQTSGLFSAPFSPRSRKNRQIDKGEHHESPTSVAGLYPVVHDLSEVEYDCCDPLSALTEILMEGSERQESVEVIAKRTATTDINLDENSKQLLQPPDLRDSTASLEDTLWELPVLPRPVSFQNRPRATSCEVNRPLSSTLVAFRTSHEGDETVQRFPEKARPSLNRHRRALSEGTAQYWTTLSKANDDISNKGALAGQKKFRDKYVLIRQVNIMFVPCHILFFKLCIAPHAPLFLQSDF